MPGMGVVGTVRMEYIYTIRSSGIIWKLVDWCINMFVYMNRKISMALNMSYTDKQTITQIAGKELEELKDLENPPGLLVTSNPLRCLKDDSLDVYYIKERNVIQICKNWVKSERDLKAALAREKTWIISTNGQMSLTNDEEMKIIIKACKAEFDFYPYLDEVLRAEATKLCAKVHSKKKLTNKSKRNIDTWHFYTRQLVEDNWYVY